MKQLKKILFYGVATCLILWVACVGAVDDEPTPGCLDALRARLALLRMERREPRSPCCLLPTYFLRAIGMRISVLFSNNDEL